MSINSKNAKKYFWIYSFLGSFLLVGLSHATPQFNIHTQDPQLKQEIKNLTVSAYSRLASFLEDSLTHPLTIYVAEDEAEFRAKLGSSFPDWGIGAAISNHNLIVLKSPDKFRYIRPFSEVLGHELAHIFLNKKSKGSDLPRWMDEGFAMMQSREWRIGLDITVVRAIFTGSILPLSEIEYLNRFSNSKAQLAYVESYLAFSYLLDEYGKEGFFELLNYLSRDKSLDYAFLKTTGSSYVGFQSEFISYLKKRYNFLALLGDTFLFWLVLAFLVVFFYFMKKYHNRRTMKRWEYEDRIGKYGYYEDDKT